MSDPKSNPEGLVEEYTSEILSANVKWAERLNQTFPRYFPDPEGRQEPKILWVGCSDSRVQDSDATATLPGTVFVHRNIANQFHPHDDNALSAFAYALKALAVQHVVVVGHEHCGGALTALREARRPQDDQVKRHHTLHDSLYHMVELLYQGHHHTNEIYVEDSKDPSDAITRWLTPLVDRVRDLHDLPRDEEKALRIVVEENVKMQVENLMQLEAFVKKSAKKRPVWVHGWVYDFSTGFLRDLHITKVLGAGDD